jgi:hypothetical protein
MHHPQETLIMSAGLGKQQIGDGDAREAATQKPSAGFQGKEVETWWRKNWQFLRSN